MKDKVCQEFWKRAKRKSEMPWKRDSNSGMQDWGSHKKKCYCRWPKGHVMEDLEKLLKARSLSPMGLSQPELLSFSLGRLKETLGGSVDWWKKFLLQENTFLLSHEN